MGFFDAASVNYHLVCFFLKNFVQMVCDPLIDYTVNFLNLVPHVESMLNHAIERFAKCSHLQNNLINRHFDDKLTLKDVYEFVDQYDGNAQLGQGSYGTVFLVRHRKTGDLFACKVRICVKAMCDF